MLKDKEDDLKRHRIFTSFLDQVVADKSGDNESFAGIEDLTTRFRSLKAENKSLRNKVS